MDQIQVPTDVSRFSDQVFTMYENAYREAGMNPDRAPVFAEWLSPLYNASEYVRLRGMAEQYGVEVSQARGIILPDTLILVGSTAPDGSSNSALVAVCSGPVSKELHFYRTFDHFGQACTGGLRQACECCSFAEFLSIPDGNEWHWSLKLKYWTRRPGLVVDFDFKSKRVRDTVTP